MDLKQAQVLITGGSEGIGYGLAKRFLSAGSKVLVTGRSRLKLEKAAAELPGLQIYVNDIGDPVQREALAAHIYTAMPGLNILINNAGIQRRVSLAADQAEWADRQAEIDILLSAPVHLNHLLIPLLLAGNKAGLIVNVTSGGAYIPQVFAPVYSACKAALHSYTMTLRHALTQTLCNVTEIIPPAVQTALAGPGLSHGAPLDEFCDSVFAELMKGDKQEIGFGPTANLQTLISAQLTLFHDNAFRFPVETYTARVIS
jgi:uncharacterized oxidoreductase